MSDQFKDKHWKPEPKEYCPVCKDKLYISSIISINGQVNFGCLNETCPVTGFIVNNELYFDDGS